MHQGVLSSGCPGYWHRSLTRTFYGLEPRWCSPVEVPSAEVGPVFACGDVCHEGKHQHASKSRQRPSMYTCMHILLGGVRVYVIYMHIYIYRYVHLHICKYIYIWRERERETHTHTHNETTHMLYSTWASYQLETAICHCKQPWLEPYVNLKSLGIGQASPQTSSTS